MKFKICSCHGYTKLDGQCIFCEQEIAAFTKLKWWDRLRLLFVRKHFVWGHEDCILTVFKRHSGVTYIVAQEPIAYGDPRHQQLDRWGL